MKLFKQRVGRRWDSGFSLMEMLMVAAILPVVFFSVFANMSSGMRVWKTLNQPISEEETVIFLDRTRTDFSNAFLFSPVPFLGDAQSVSFAGPVQTEQALGGERGIGRVTYRLDESAGALVRQESNISELHKNAAPRSKVVLMGVASFSIEYLSYLPAESAYVWQEAWQPGKRPLPAAVRLTIGRTSGEGLVKSFLVPSGN